MLAVSGRGVWNFGIYGGYLLCFGLFTKVLTHLPLGLAYAVWAGVVSSLSVLLPPVFLVPHQSCFCGTLTPNHVRRTTRVWLPSYNPGYRRHCYHLFPLLWRANGVAEGRMHAAHHQRNSWVELARVGRELVPHYRQNCTEF